MHIRWSKRFLWMRGSHLRMHIWSGGLEIRSQAQILLLRFGTLVTLELWTSPKVNPSSAFEIPVECPVKKSESSACGPPRRILSDWLTRKKGFTWARLMLFDWWNSAGYCSLFEVQWANQPTTSTTSWAVFAIEHNTHKLVSSKSQQQEQQKAQSFYVSVVWVHEEDQRSPQPFKSSSQKESSILSCYRSWN